MVATDQNYAGSLEIKKLNEAITITQDLCDSLGLVQVKTKNFTRLVIIFYEAILEQSEKKVGRKDGDRKK